MDRDGQVAERPLRVGVVSPIAEAVRRDSPQSIEQLVWLMTDELVRLGHDVTLFATGDSLTAARLHAVYPSGYTIDPDLWNWQFHESMHVAAAFEQATSFDVIHSHNYSFALPFSRLVTTPTVHTYHILPDPDISRAYRARPEAQVVATSRFQRDLFEIPSIPVVHHGIETDAFAYSERAGEYLVFLGRMMPEKGPVEAIEAAVAAGMRLVLAGPPNDYFQEVVAPLVRHPDVEYVGPVDREDRAALLGNAAALLYPLQWPEPFGLVMVEAMACGTPVVALEVGAVPEIVDNGVTGYHAPDLESFATLIPHAVQLDRRQVRRRAVERFDYRRMVREYLRVYDRVASPEAAGIG